MPRPDLLQRFDFLVHDIARISGIRFDQLARAELGLSRAQVRLLSVLDLYAGPEGMTQNELAEHLDTSAMAVAALCARMEVAGWITRHECELDRRARRVQLDPSARRPLADALRIADRLQKELLAGMSAAERRQLVTLMQRVHANAQRLRGDPPD